MQSSHIVSLGLRSGRLRVAVFHNARSLRRAQNVFAKHCNRALNISLPSCQGFATRRLCLPCSPAQTPSLFVRDVIICAVLAVLSAVPIPRSHSESRTSRCGCADHHYFRNNFPTTHLIFKKGIFESRKGEVGSVPGNSTSDSRYFLLL